MRRAALLALLVVVAAAAAAVSASDANAHRSGCHRWHSCPSDTGSYTCGDTGYSNYCGSLPSAPRTVVPTLPEPTSLEVQGSTDVPVAAGRTYRVWVRNAFDLLPVVEIRLSGPGVNVEAAVSEEGLGWAEWSDLSWSSPGVKQVTATGYNAYGTAVYRETLAVTVFQPRPKIEIETDRSSAEVGEEVTIRLRVESQDTEHGDSVQALRLRFSDQSQPAERWAPQSQYWAEGNYEFSYAWKKPGRYTVWAEAVTAKGYRGGASVAVEVKAPPPPVTTTDDEEDAAAGSGASAPPAAGQANASSIEIGGRELGIGGGALAAFLLVATIVGRRSRGKKTLGPMVGWLFTDPDEVDGFFRKAIHFPVMWVAGLTMIVAPFAAIGLLIWAVDAFDSSSPEPARARTPQPVGVYESDYSGDLDCDDMGETDIYVGDNDPHGLDADGDGIGCES